MSKRKVVVGSLNKVKVEAIKAIFNEDEILSINACSLVSAQPYGDEETILGAINRAKESKEHGDIGIGLEGGVSETSYGLLVISYGALVDENNNIYIAGGTRIPLPRKVAEGIKKGFELGDLMDQYASKKNVKHDDGAVGILTNHHIKRQAIFEHIANLLMGSMKAQKNNIILKE